MNGNGDGNRDVWKWVTAIVVTALLAGAPGYIIAIRSPSQAEVQLIRDRQLDVLQRLAVVERRLDETDAELLVLRALIVALETELRGTPAGGVRQMSGDKLAGGAVAALATIAILGIGAGIVIAYLGEPVGSIITLVVGAVSGIVAIVLRERKP